MANEVFADAWLWIALANSRDEWRDKAEQAFTQTRDVRLVTTHEVLGEFLTYFAKRGPISREGAGRLIEETLADPRVTVLPQTPATFEAGVRLNRQRPDKGYSYVDCVSMAQMKELAITRVIPGDAHFAQEGFTLIPG